MDSASVQREFSWSTDTWCCTLMLPVWQLLLAMLLQVSPTTLLLLLLLLSLAAACRYPTTPPKGWRSY